MTLTLITRGAIISATALAVSVAGAGVAQASPDTVNQDNHAGQSRSGKTARNNTNGLDWGDDWSLGGFPPINLSSLPAPNVNLSVPLSLGLPGLSLPSLNLNLFH
ncbi:MULTISPECIES: hypothetical protein [Mycobacteriaceae]|uniref:Secreted protein n=1 Tax=Mycolicibacterium mucogenicum DSM 44124 TaxID=1226753 RepID=A0A8H2JF29_MYCMU|nr:MULTISPECIES: hypothetical protein [Mycobacteriaceae]KAB7755854.1 hypothetical protein MMUC44124_17715 [Mycolicibacterium mucogenicum DSM 44124]QPG68095.1 hypothetical protein C1S78_021765 [Mycolicibacterium mucogenicum DSM 44124]SEB25155.1 hypothetical protein SAMN04488580_1163 [Mycobacterium sp. 283mftsu]